MRIDERAALAEAPYVVWVDHGCEGWSPTPCNTLDEAMRVDNYGSAWMITKHCAWHVVEEGDE